MCGRNRCQCRRSPLCCRCLLCRRCGSGSCRGSSVWKCISIVRIPSHETRNFKCGIPSFIGWIRLPIDTRCYTPAKDSTISAVRSHLNSVAIRNCNTFFNTLWHGSISGKQRICNPRIRLWNCITEDFPFVMIRIDNRTAGGLGS